MPARRKISESASVLAFHELLVFQTHVHGSVPITGGQFRELCLFGRAFERRGRSRTARYGLLNVIEVSRPYEALMFHCFIAVMGLARKFGFLQLAIGGHPISLVLAGEFEHRQIRSVESGQRNELKFVAHRGQLS